MFSFLILQVIFVFIFSIIFLELGKVQKIVTTDKETLEELGEINFYSNLQTSFNIASTGSFDNYQEITGFDFVVFIVTSLFQNIVMLNLLIAIISDTFDKVQEKQTALDCQERCKLMLDIEVLLYWNRAKGKRQFIHICQYLTAHNEETSETEQWMGKIRSLKQEIANIRETTEEKLHQMQKRTRIQ